MISPELLRHYPFFAGLSNEQIVFMAKFSSELIVEEDHYFFHEGDTLNNFYLVVEGVAAIVVDVPKPDVEHKISEQLTGNMQTSDIVIQRARARRSLWLVGLDTPSQCYGWGKSYNIVSGCRL